MYDVTVQKFQPMLISFQLPLCNLSSITTDNLTVKKTISCPHGQLIYIILDYR